MALRYNIKQAVDKPKGTRVLVPMIQPSLAFERAYLKELRKLLHGAAGGVRDIIIPSYGRKREVNRLTGDADEDAFTAFANLLKSLARIATAQLSTLLSLEGKRHTEQWLSTVKKTFSIDLKGIVDAEGLTNYLEAAALRNASLITGMTDDLIKRVQLDTINALVGGESVATLKEKIKHSLNVSDSRAQLIAYDQTSKLNADLNKKRHQEAGIDSYIWRTSQDERVRPRHARLEGTKYKYDEPTGAEEGLPPGQPIRCRCIAQAVVDWSDLDEEPKPRRPVRAEAVEEPRQVNATTAKARAKVLELGKDGSEHMVVMSGAKELSTFTSGDSYRISIPPEMWKTLTDPKANLTVHHNHPIDRVSFSPADLMAFRAALGMNEFHAHSQSASFRLNRTAKTFKINEKLIKSLTQEYDKKAAPQFVKRVATIQEIENNRPHYIAKRLHEQGIVSYEATGAVDEIEAVLKRVIGKK